MKYSFFSLLLIVSAVACRKPVGCDVCPSEIVVDSTLETLSKHNWTIYRLDMNGLDVFGLVIPTCQQDDSYRFFKDSVMSQYDNNNKCAGNSDSTNSHWQFYNGTKSLIATVVGTTDTAQIESITGSELKLSLDYNGNPAIIYFKK